MARPRGRKDSYQSNMSFQATLSQSRDHLLQGVELPRKQPRTKAPKGSVVVQVFRGRLRLCWSHGGKRYFHYIGLPDSKLNQRRARQIADQIEGDIATNNFDPTLGKYKTEQQVQRSRLSLVQLFQRYMKEKAKEVVPKTMEKYEATLGYLQRHLSGLYVEDVDLRKAEQFLSDLQDQGLSSRQIKRRLEEIQACWLWAISQELMEVDNPWGQVLKRIKISPKALPKPFTQDEVLTIVQGFRCDRYYSHYVELVEFLFSTGCRTGEAIGLKWEHVSDDCSQVWIGEIVTRGKTRPTKCHKARHLTLPTNVVRILRDRKPKDLNPDALVFPSPQGMAIDDHLFSQRAWRKVLNKAGIAYRRLYCTRHTFISHALDQGCSPLQVCQFTGHSPRTLLEHYAGFVNNLSSFPVLVGGTYGN